MHHAYLFRPFRAAWAVLWLAALLLAGGCDKYDGIARVEDTPRTVRTVYVENATDQTLYVGAHDARALILIASELSVAPHDTALVAPGATRALPVDIVVPDFGPGDAVTFTVYTHTGGITRGAATYRLAASLARSFERLHDDSLRLTITPEHLRPEGRFGDPYHLLTREWGGDAFDAHDPYLDGDELRAWVGFGGCSEGTFTVSADLSGPEARLALVFDYPVPPGEIDCERYNMRPIAVDVPAEALARPRVVLLNPNPDADPYADAFVLR